jgi:hypothetical protein
MIIIAFYEELVTDFNAPMPDKPVVKVQISYVVGYDNYCFL